MSDKRKDYISWDEYFMGVAMLSGNVFSRSTSSILLIASPTIMASSLINIIFVSVVPITGVMII